MGRLTPTEPGTPQTAADERWLLLVQELFLGRHDPQYTVGEHRPLIEKAIRSARDAEIRALEYAARNVVAAWKIPNIANAMAFDGLVEALRLILDADTPS